jgi:hypothetical protein
LFLILRYIEILRAQHGSTALDVAREKGHAAIIALLMAT